MSDIPPQPTQPLNYQTPVFVPKRPITSIPWTIALSVGVLMVIAISLFIEPRAEQIFRDFKAELPGITKLSIAVARQINDNYLWLAMPAIPVVVPMIFALIFTGPEKKDRPGRTVSRSIVLSIWMVLIIGLFTSLALFAPMIVIITTVSGQGKK